ncbi:MAG: patatin-like phospholipase family protein [Planctomycetota bacterium]
MTTVPPQLNGEIALALSGGGYRAAAFHLGVLTYLEALGWKDQLSQLSTVSGGTFVGAAYTCSLIDGEPTDSFARRFYTFMRTTHLVKLALHHLAHEAPGVPSGRKDLIVSAARVYAETFMARQDGAPRLFREVLEADIPLREVVFNATEFRHGIAFRFLRSESHRARIGNHYFNVPKEVAGEIQMADIVAASSCFPGGFEPLAFPIDFAWPKGKIPELPPSLAKSLETPVALMDGGVYDNQGMSSLMLMDRRSSDHLALVIVSDVDQLQDSLYSIPPNVKLGLAGRLTLGWLNVLSLLLFATCVATVLVLAIHWRTRGTGDLADVFGYAVPMVLAVTTGLALTTLRRVVRSGVDCVPQVGAASWHQLRRIKLEELVNMLNLRATSLLSLTSSVFMARIRRLVSRTVYQRDGYRGKLIANYIYSLQTPSRFDANLEREGIEPPSIELQAVIDAAATMPTTLWFDDDQPYRLPSLVAAGQANLIYKLMIWVQSQRRDHEGCHDELWCRLKRDWNVLCKEPYAMVPLEPDDPRPPLPPPRTGGSTPESNPPMAAMS